MEELATVVGVFDNKVQISFTQHLHCEKCGRCQKSQDGQVYLEIENTRNLSIGDKVFVKIKPSNLKISFVIYGLPILFFIVGLFVGLLLFRTELYAFLSGIVFLIFSVWPIRTFAKKNNPEIRMLE